MRIGFLRQNVFSTSISLKLGFFVYASFFGHLFLGYRTNAYSQRVPIVPSYPSRIPVAPFSHNHSQGAYWHRSSLTRHRSLSDFTEHENSYHNPWLDFAIPPQNLPLWNENFPPTRLDANVASCHQGGPYSYKVPSTQSSLARSLSQQNLPAKFSSLSNAFDTQLRNLCMGIERRFNNNNNNYFWVSKNSNINSDYGSNIKNELEGLNLKSADFVKNNVNAEYNPDAQWAKTPSSSSESTSTSELVRSYKKNIKKSINHISGNPKNLEKWPKSLETLPKTPTDIRSKSVLSVDNNLLSNYPVFPCVPTGPTPELNRSSATSAASCHGYGHKTTDRSKFIIEYLKRRSQSSLIHF